MSYVVMNKFKAKVNGELVDIELSSDILPTKEEADELAVTLTNKMGFTTKVESYDSEPVYPYGSFAGEE